MEIHIKLFSIAKDLLGQEEISLQVPSPMSLHQLKKLVGDHYPPFKKMTGRWAVNLDFVSESTWIYGNEEIAWIPPVSGG